jgi:PAS domain S-box-containing protein
MFTDITDRKRVEDALREERNFSNAMLDTTGTLVCVLDCDGRIVRFNRACEKKIGHTSSEVMGRVFWDFLLMEDEKSGVIEKFKWLEAGQFPIDYENHWVARNGELVLVSWSNTVILDQDGEIEFIIATGMDITERKRVEEALKKAHDNLEVKVKERTAELEDAYKSLKESEKRLAEAQKMAHIGNYDNNLVANELYWSDELYRILGLKPQEGMTYDGFLSYVHPDDRDYVHNFTNEAFNGNVYAVNYKIVRPDGEERIIHSERDVIFDEKNYPVRIKGTLQDITESKRAEEKIQSLANIVESSEDAIGTLSLDGIITSWNKGAEQVYGYSAE